MQQTTSTQKIPKKLGQVLVEHGWADGHGVLRALQSQRSAGGRLGTRLLEMNLVEEDRLLDALAEQAGAPAADPDQLRSIPEQVIDLVPERVAQHCQAVPFAASDQTLDVATLDVHDSRLGALSACTNRKVRAHVTSEPRIYEAMGRYYGQECPSRYARLVDRLNRSRYLWKESTRVEVDPHGQVEVEWLATPDLDEPVPLLGASALTPLATGTNSTLQEVREQLANVPTVEEIGDLVLRFATQSFSRSALFRINKGNLKGWKMSGGAAATLLIQSVEINLREPSILHELLNGVELHVGPLAPMPAHRRLVSAWGGDWPGECVALAIRVRGKLTAVLYGDRGPLNIPEDELTGLKEVAQLAGQALEICLLRKKNAQKAVSAGRFAS